MLKIGLTGNIGSGKTMVCQVFAKLGVPVFNADEEAKKILNGSSLRPHLIEAFGSSIIDTSNQVNRKDLAKLVFSDKEQLNKLNALIHPGVRAAFQNWCLDYQKEPYIIHEAAIIFENDISYLFDKIIVVSAPKNIRLKRVVERDSVNEIEVLARMSNQWDDRKKELAADFNIINDGKKLILPQVIKLHQALSKTVL